MLIHRNIEKTFEDVRNHFPCVILTGPRQTGKSTFLRNVYEKNGYNYVSLDDTVELALAKSDPRTFFSVHPVPVIIDEAQKAPEIFPEVERIINEKRSLQGNKASAGMFILSGSSRHQLLENAEESLAGRCGILDMDPLSISEITGRDSIPFLSDLTGIPSRRADSSFQFDHIFEYIVRGSMPQLYDDPDTSLSVFYSSYITTYIEKDLRELLEVKNDLKFIQFMRILASNTGQELNYENYAREVGISTNTVKSWISTLVKTGIVYLLQPYSEESIVKRIVKRPKMYFFDTGLACYLAGIDGAGALTRSFMKGRFFETFAMNEIRKSFRINGIHINYYYYRDSNQNEIDLVYIQDGTIHLVEMKSGTNFGPEAVKGFHQLDQTRYIKGSNAIVCTTDKLSAIPGGTYIIPVSSI